MADKTLLVPGTQATTLCDQHGRIVYNAVRVSLGLQEESLGGRPPSEWQDLLSLEHAPGDWFPSRTSLLPSTVILSGPVCMTPYDRLPSPIDTFPYDWRLDLRLNAARLIDRLRSDRPSGRDRWNLIGHSQGGLLIVLASQMTTDIDEFSRLVARVCLVGCPLAGTLRALEALTVGRGDFGEHPFLYDAARGMAQTWPSIYQMLPSWDSVVGADLETLPVTKQFTEIGGYPGTWAEGMNEDHLLRCRETQAMLEGPLSRFGSGVATLVIQGEKHDTPTWIIREGSELSTNGHQPGSRPELEFLMEPGDTLVPSEETLDWGGRPLSLRTLRLSGKVKEHAFLCDGKFVVRKIDEFLREPAPPAP